MDKTINYSQCWEDPQILIEALSIDKNDTVLSITSGGDNSFALLLAGSKKVISIDLNEAQNYLLELKRIAAEHLSYEEYLELLGVRHSERREALFKKIQDGLTPAARTWWSNHTDLINRGAINSGRFEKFTISFSRYILPLIHSQRKISKLLACRSVEEQRMFYKNEWDSWRWRFFFGLASNRLMLKRYARQQGMFAYTEGGTVADVYRKRLERNLTSVPIQGNYFLRYSLTGKYGSELPPYLEEEGHARLRDMPQSAISVITTNLVSYLQSVPDNTFSKFNLSDIFEALSLEDNDSLWSEIVRTATPGAKIGYWNNLVRRTYPAHLSASIKTDEDQLSKLRAKDKVFFYDRFYCHTILK